ncbi:MAG: hypothetical protein LBU32_20630 [Clostridiales bacterium]|nr:hypothetical protein [Clostridiales bacterium]
MQQQLDELLIQITTGQPLDKSVKVSAMQKALADWQQEQHFNAEMTNSEFATDDPRAASKQKNKMLEK